MESAQRRAGRWVPGAFVVLAAALPYLPLLTAPTIGYDDPFYIERQPYWREATLETLWDAVRRPVFANYQPLHLASYWLDRLLWGPSHVGLRATQLALYCACVAGVLSLARRLALPRAGVVTAGLVFATHPSHVECVAWLSQRKDLLFLSFMLLGLNVWLGPTPAPVAADQRDGPDPSWRRRLGACALLVVAMLAKTTAVVAVPMLGILALARRRLRRDLVWLVGLGLVALAVAHLGASAQAEFGTLLAPTPWDERAVRVTRAMAWYVGQAVLPLQLTPIPAEPSPTVGTAEVVKLIGLALTLVGMAWSWARGGRTFAALGAWFFVALAPTSGIVPFVAFVQDRYLFAPSVAVALGAGLLVAGAGRRWRRARLCVCAGAALVSLLALSLAAPYARAWRGDLSLWTWSVRTEPQSIRALESWIAVALEPDDPASRERVEPLVLELHARFPERRIPALAAAEVHRRRGNLAGWRAALARVAATEDKAALMLADDALRGGDLDASARWLDLAARTAPRNGAEVSCGRGRLAFARGDHAAAAAAFRAATEALVEWEEAWLLRSLAERAAGDVEAARTSAGHLRDAPRAALLAHLLLDADDVAGAGALLARASRPHAEEALVRARMAARRGEREAARAQLARALELDGGVWPPRRVELEPELRALVPP